MASCRAEFSPVLGSVVEHTWTDRFCALRVSVHKDQLFGRQLSKNPTLADLYADPGFMFQVPTMLVINRRNVTIVRTQCLGRLGN